MAILQTDGGVVDSRAVANRILDIAHDKGQSLTIMQLVKLIYFAQGWHLAFFDKPLVRQSAQAWQYGPVYPLVYKAFPKAGSSLLASRIISNKTEEPFSAELANNQDELLTWIVDKYGPMHAFDLSRLTHAEYGPWKMTVDKTGLYSDIPDALMKSYFKQFVKDDAATQ